MVNAPPELRVTATISRAVVLIAEYELKEIWIFATVTDGIAVRLALMKNAFLAEVVA